MNLTYKGQLKTALEKEGVKGLAVETVQCVSTNLYVRGNLSTRDRVVVAKVQSDGRGRDGRKFVSKRGGVYMTLQLNRDLAPKEATKYVILAGLAVQRMLAEYDVKATIKWPNDIMVRGKKICGILSEYAVTPKNKSLIIGIGINVKNDISEVKDIATTMMMQAVSAPLAEVAAKVIKHLLLSEKEYYETLLTSYKKISDAIGKRIRVGDKTGIAIGLTEEGYLLADFDGVKEKIVSEDVEILAE